MPPTTAPPPALRMDDMDGRLAAIIGAAIGALAGLGGALVQARSTRQAARETDERRRAAEAKDRLRTFRVEQIRETRSQIGKQLDFLELAASGRLEDAQARDRAFWAEPSSRVMNLSLLGDSGLIQKYVELKSELDGRAGGPIEDVPRIQNMHVLVMAPISFGP